MVRPDRVGDVVLSTPVYRSLRTLIPGAFIGVMVSSYTSPLLHGNPNIDVIIHDDARLGRPQDFWRQVGLIRSYEFDTALLLMPTKRLAYMLFLAGIPYRLGVGHILYEVITFTHGVSRNNYNPLRHESEYMLDLVRRIAGTNNTDGKIQAIKPEIFLDESERNEAVKYLEEKRLDCRRPIVGIHPGSGRSAPNWNPKKYLELMNKLADNDVQVLVTGSPEEKSLEKNFSRQSGKRIATSFGELSIRKLAAVISRLSVFVSSSTGPMHIAAALGVETVSMFCPLTACSPELWGPKGNRSSVILPPDGFCQLRCPGDPHICTFGEKEEGITVERVYEATRDILDKTEAVSINKGTE